MSRTAEIEAFRRLRVELASFAAAEPACEIDHDSAKAVLLRMGDGDDMSLLDASIGSFELHISSGQGLNYELLRSERDVEKVLALCDAVVAGRGVSLSGPNGYPARSWIFLDSRGFKEAVTTTAVSIRSCRRARSIKKSLWQRKRLPILKAEFV
ncbi:hypothetical protein [Brevundimonas sp.]|uniref:hypothetical protein n=1 Tax=Brevundimonas sp. TaxID=1871086 RepID=UPI0028A59A27|nr:hypothetical protein [Brevundimonas sp.]